MVYKRVVRVSKLFLLGGIALMAIGAVVMALWNELMPAIFGWGAITFWQALGLLLLSRILFGHLGGPGPHMHWRRRMAERWNQMTPEERVKFMEGMKRSCGPSDAEVAGAKEG